MKKEILLPDESDTLSLGKKLAAVLPTGGFIALYGELGTGKSVLARGIGAQLGICNVTSPTFTIMQRYDSKPIFFHIDAYRLSNEDELFDVGFDECLQSNVLVALEWADIVPNALPSKRIDIYISGTGTQPRNARIECAEGVLSKEQFLSL